MSVYYQPGRHQYEHQTIAVVNQDPPVQATVYTILAETRNVRVLYLATRQIHTEAGAKNVRVQLTGDGVVFDETDALADSTWYYWYLSPTADGIISDTTLRNFGYTVDGRFRNFTATFWITDAPGTAQELDGRLVYEVLR